MMPFKGWLAKNGKPKGAQVTKPDRTQDRLSRVMGLDAAFRNLARSSGPCVTILFASLRESGIPAERELEHAVVVRPAIEAIETAFFVKQLIRLPQPRK
jgi:hypothetical protein